MRAWWNIKYNKITKLIQGIIAFKISYHDGMIHYQPLESSWQAWIVVSVSTLEFKRNKKKHTKTTTSQLRSRIMKIQRRKQCLILKTYTTYGLKKTWKSYEVKRIMHNSCYALHSSLFPNAMQMKLQYLLHLSRMFLLLNIRP